MEIYAAAMLAIISGIANGETRPGPFSSSFGTSCSAMCRPPTREPKITPVR